MVKGTWKTHNVRTNKKISDYYTKKTDAKVKEVVKKALTSTDVRYKDYDSAQSALYHDVPYVMNLFGNIAIGTAENQRETDHIFLKKMFMKLRVSMLAANLQDTYLRVMIVKNTKEFQTGSDAIIGTTGAGLPITEYLRGPSPNFAYLNPWNSKDSTILYDKTHRITTTHNVARLVTFDLNKVWNQKFVYGKGSLGGKNTNTYLILIPHTRGGAYGTTEVMDVILRGTLVYSTN